MKLKYKGCGIVVSRGNPFGGSANKSEFLCGDGDLCSSCKDYYRGCEDTEKRLR